MTLRRWLVALAAVAVAALALAVVPPRWIVGAQDALEPWRPWLGALRAAAIVATWVWWDRLVGALPGVQGPSLAYLRGRRGFWCGALAAIELVLVRNVFGALWRLFG